MCNFIDKTRGRYLEDHTSYVFSIEAKGCLSSSASLLTACFRAPRVSVTVSEYSFPPLVALVFPFLSIFIHSFILEIYSCLGEKRKSAPIYQVTRAKQVGINCGRTCLVARYRNARQTWQNVEKICKLKKKWKYSKKLSTWQVLLAVISKKFSESIATVRKNDNRKWEMKYFWERKMNEMRKIERMAAWEVER